uniref:THO complex subunit 4 (inferred by orthology to a human protein) n=1 Tax=Strongyloides venezuelensis TaxID=75913 RepID=A0A0K0FVV8_STRVS
MSAVDAVNMSLDDIIAKTRGTKSLRGRGASRLGKAGRRGDKPGRQWKNDKYDAIYGRGRRINQKAPRRTTGGAGAKFANRAGPVSTIGKLLISNLPKNVSTLDLQQLFKGYPFKTVTVNHNEMGESLGTAMVVTRRRGDVLKLMKDFAGIAIDGRAVQMVDLSSDSNRDGTGAILDRISVKKVASGGIRKEKGGIVKGRKGGAVKRKGAPKKGGKKFDRKKKEKITTEDLDKDLEEYMSRGKDKKAEETMES